jgi:beta-lactamase class A
MWTRRGLLGAALASGAMAAEAAPLRKLPRLIRPPAPEPEPPYTRNGAVETALADIRRRVGGRLGVAALDTGSGRWIGLNPGGRYALTSTFKLPLAAAVLREVDAGRLTLDREVAFTQADILEYAPVVRAHAAEGRMTVGALAEAAVTVSDNSAANLLLPLVGGPRGLTRFMQANGGGDSRLDRTEPALNSNLRRDHRDTTTPESMVRMMRRILVGKALSDGSRERLNQWLIATQTGTARLRAGFPPGWKAGDKTGTGDRGAANDVAILWPPSRPPILVASYLDAADVKLADRDMVHASVGALVARHFAQFSA